MGKGAGNPQAAVYVFEDVLKRARYCKTFNIISECTSTNSIVSNRHKQQVSRRAEGHPKADRRGRGHRRMSHPPQSSHHHARVRF